ncbi:VanZ family protein [Congregibacter sp.]|uniref:VanZ family protein n=1 Tax=Congregibacter sp. TaxID=2744308 RepID=UPI003F6C0800
MPNVYVGTAVVKSVNDPQLGFSQTLLRWRWLLVYLLASWLLAALIPSHFSIGPSQALNQQPLAWSLSPGITEIPDGELLRWSAQREGIHWASRPLDFPSETEFVSVSFCLARDVAPETAAVMLASVRYGRLDFNRQYRVNSFYSGLSGECFDESIPRREGDGPAILQLQFLTAPAELSLESLAVTALRENPVWRLLRMGMLVVGVMLLVLLFRDYRYTRPGLLVIGGLGIVLGILFGCCVSVNLKADIYELLTGGRSIDARVSLQALLQMQFPIGGFSLFTFMHAVLFCGATFFLGLARRYGWLDLLMLAPVTETLQLFVPGRGPGIQDMLVDWIGIAVAVLLVVLLRRSHRVRAFLEN